METVHIFISGLVQGVGFRNFVRYKARKLGLVGWVKNLSDGRVEVTATVSLNSTRKDIEKLIAACRKGPMISQVKDVQVEWIDSSEKFEVFTIYR